jgi:benzoyl-CoA reductase subunit D
VIQEDSQVLGKGVAPAGIKKAEAVEALYDRVLIQSGFSRKDVKRVVATGSAAKRVVFVNQTISDITADTRGVVTRFPDARIIIDVGAEEGRAIRINPEGRVLDFAINDKCAAGTGTFVEAMARALEVSIEEFSRIALQSTRSIPMNAQCVVFGESEVISLIHQNVPKPDISRAVLDAIAARVGSLARVVGLEREVVLIGGMAKNEGFVDSLKKNLQMPLIVPDDSDYIGALGAAETALSGVME